MRWNSLRSRCLHLATFGLGLAFVLAAQAAPKTAVVARPNPALDPAAVVRIQLDAMKNVDKPAHDAGFATVFRFASPGNQSQTGPLSHFIGLLRKSYPEMLNHRSATLAPVLLQGDRALQGVEVIDSDGLSHQYVFILSRQPDGPYKNCWMTDGVMENRPDDPKLQAT